VVKHLFAPKPIITTLIHDKDNLVAYVAKAILQISGKALICTKTNNNYSAS